LRIQLILLATNGVSHVVSPSREAHARRVTWAEVLNDAEHRPKFVQKSLQYESDRDSGLASMRAKYASYLPPEALDVVASAADTEEAADPQDVESPESGEKTA
jgi:hypothetical protein